MTLSNKEKYAMKKKLIDEYTKYINARNDEELKLLAKNECFTMGSLKYYTENGMIDLCGGV
jgi:hypothetical protein